MEFYLGVSEYLLFNSNSKFITAAAAGVILPIMGKKINRGKKCSLQDKESLLSPSFCRHHETNICNNGPLLLVADMASSVTDLNWKHLLLGKSISVECTSEPVNRAEPCTLALTSGPRQEPVTDWL